MTFEEAQIEAKKWQNLIGQKTLNGSSISLIAIRKGEDADNYTLNAWYYNGSQSGQVGEDPIEWYKDRPLNGKRRCFGVYEANKIPWSFSAQGDVIINAGGGRADWEGKTLQEIRPLLQEMEVTLREDVYEPKFQIHWYEMKKNKADK